MQDSPVLLFHLQAIFKFLGNLCHSHHHHHLRFNVRLLGGPRLDVASCMACLHPSLSSASDGLSRSLLRSLATSSCQVFCGLPGRRGPSTVMSIIFRTHSSVVFLRMWPNQRNLDLVITLDMLSRPRLLMSSSVGLLSCNETPAIQRTI